MTGITRRQAISTLLAATAATATSLLALHAAQADTPGTDTPEKTPGTPEKTPGTPGGAKPGTDGLKAQFTPSDREMNQKCINKTLSEAPKGKTWSWKNPKSGNSGTVTPTSPLLRQAGQTCRTFDESVKLKDGRSEQVSARACRKSDGSWEITA
jgi:surface antigen